MFGFPLWRMGRVFFIVLYLPCMPWRSSSSLSLMVCLVQTSDFGNCMQQFYSSSHPNNCCIHFTKPLYISPTETSIPDLSSAEHHNIDITSVGYSLGFFVLNTDVKKITLFLQRGPIFSKYPYCIMNIWSPWWGLREATKLQIPKGWERVLGKCH